MSARRLRDLVLRCVAPAFRSERREDRLGDLEELWHRSREEDHSATSTASWLGETLRIAARSALQRARDSGRERLHSLHPRHWRPLPHDLRAALRRLRSSPVFSLVALLTVALGAAATLLTSTLVQSVLLEPLPYADPDRLVALFATERDGAELRNPASPANFLDWREQATQVEELTAARPWSPTIQGLEKPFKVQGLRASPSLFGLLGARAALGTSQLPDLRAGEVVLSHDLWRRLGADRAAPGEILRLDGEPHRIAAVMPEGFVFPPFWADEAELWAPLDLGVDPSRSARFLRVFGRLAKGSDLAAARAELEAVAARLRVAFPEANRGVGVQVEPLREPMVSESRPALIALLAASLVLVALVSFNLASLLLARRIRQASELRTRAALGASRLRLVAGAWCETSMVVASGLALGVGAAVAALPALRVWADPFLPRLARLELEPGVVAGVVVLHLLLTIPLAFPGSRPPAGGLASRSPGGRRSQRASRLLVVGELAVTVTLLVAAGLLVGSFLRLVGQDPGFVAQGALAVDLDLTAGTHAEPERQTVFYRRLEEALTARPEIESAGLTNHLPVDGDLWRTRVFRPGVSSPDDDLRAAVRVASPGYRRAIGARLESGRWIEDGDRSEAASVAVINRRLAEILWPGADPVGAELVSGSLDAEGARRRVIGVVADLKQEGVAAAVVPEIYVPLAQNPFPWFRQATLVVRSELPVEAAAARVAAAVRALDPAVPLHGARALTDVLARDVRRERLQTMVFGVFAGVSLMLAAFGLFAVISYAAATRTFEFALRLALGSHPRQIAGLVLRDGLRTALVGIALGGIASLFVARVLTPLLYGLTPWDPRVYGVVVVLALGCTVGGCLLPALRALRLSAGRALRES